MNLISATVITLAVLYLFYWSPGTRRWFFFLLRLVPRIVWLLLLAFVLGVCVGAGSSSTGSRPGTSPTAPPPAAVAHLGR